ncbi:helix-turn-helix domain-containing protein [Streptomyces anulatus]
MAYGHRTPHQSRIRAHVVLHAARGRSNACIARETGLHVDTVRTWRGRFADEGMPGLADRRRPGRPPSFTALQTAQVKALACRPGQGPGLPPRSRPWPANYPPRPARRWPAGRARKWPARPPHEASPRPCRTPPCTAGWPKTRSSPGSTAPGSSSTTQTSAPRPPVCWTCTPAHGRGTARTGRVRHQRRREDLHPGPLPLPPHPGPRTGPCDADQPHLRLRRCPGLPGRLRRPPCEGAQPHRAQKRHRPVHEPGHPGHEPRALRQPPKGCSGSSTTAPPTAGRRPPTA